jgi:hypothetical protein
MRTLSFSSNKQVILYGDEEVKSIKQHFSSVLNQDLDETELLNEWFLLKALVYEKYAKHNYK